jgi:hypothetical protein
MQQPSEMSEPRVPALDDVALGWARRAIWAVCICIYLTVFVGGIQAGGAELITMGRAAAFTLGAAVLGRLVLSLLERASLPVQKGPMDVQEGTLGSLVDLVASANVGHHDKAEAA